MRVQGGGGGDSYPYYSRRPDSRREPSPAGDSPVSRKHGHATAGARRFSPNRNYECSRGWSGAAAMRPDAEPVESG
jgi:hypothetical protein